MKRRRAGSFLRQHILTILLFLTIATAVFIGIWDANEQNLAKERQAAENSLWRAIVTCYAIEGRYPESYEYIRTNYNVRIDENKFTVVYGVFASNQPPYIAEVHEK